MVDFIVDNWQIIVSGFLAFLTLLAQFAKRKNVAYSFLDYAYYVLQIVPLLIQQAEELYSDGEAKKKYVVHQCIMYFKKFVDINSLDPKQLSQVDDIFSNYVEDVLSTPQKKEVQK